MSEYNRHSLNDVPITEGTMVSQHGVTGLSKADVRAYLIADMKAQPFSSIRCTSGYIYYFNRDGYFAGKENLNDLKASNMYFWTRLTSNDSSANLIDSRIQALLKHSKVVPASHDLPDFDIEADIPKVIKVNKSDLKLSARDIINIVDNPHIYWSGNKSLDPVEDLLLQTILLYPDKFDEIFSVDQGKPESPVMEKYLNKLGELTTEEILDKGEIDDIDLLKKKAYEFSGYKSKSLEQVSIEGDDYSDYMRFLLTKGDRVIISKEQKEYFDSLLVLIEDDENVNFSLNKKSKVNSIFSKQECSLFSLEDTVPLLRTGEVTIATYFMYIDKHLKDVESVIEDKKVDVRIALMNHLISSETKLKSKSKELVFSLFVSDKNLNYTSITIKPNTLNKWAKKLEELLKVSIPAVLDSSGYKTYPLKFYWNSFTV